MASVLSYSMSDPFAPPSGSKSVDDQATRYSSPPFSPPMLNGIAAVPQHSLPSTASTRESVSSSRPQTSRNSAYQTIVDEFGAYLPEQGTTMAAAAQKAHRSNPPPPTMPVHLPSHDQMVLAQQQHQQHHHHQSQSQSASQATAAQRKRQSHNPAATLQASPPKAEYLSDEYVLHPSVHAYKQAHPNRHMIALGQYILLQTLGEGEFGKVKLGVHSDYGVEVAIKLIRRGALDDEARANKVEREIEVLRVSGDL